MVACGSEQFLEENYTLTFVAFMEMTTSKEILALSQIWGVPARHGDVPNAYVKAFTDPQIDIHLSSLRNKWSFSGLECSIQGK